MRGLQESWHIADVSIYRNFWLPNHGGWGFGPLTHGPPGVFG